MKTVLQGARDMERAALAMRGQVPTRTVAVSAQIVKTATLVEMTKIAPSGRFSHVGKNGARVGVSYKLSPGRGTALVSAQGPWQLVEETTKAHPVFGRNVGALQRRADGLLDRSRAGRREAKQNLLNALFGAGGAFSGAKVLKLPGGLFRYRVNIPAIPGRHPWAHGVEKATPLVGEAMRKTVTESLRAIFR